MRLSNAFLRRDKITDATEWHSINGVRLHIASMSCDGMTKFFELPEHVRTKGEAFVSAVADNLLLDWENLQDDDGNEMECNRENKIMLLTDYTEVLTAILEFARKPSNFVSANQAVEDDTKNS